MLQVGKVEGGSDEPETQSKSRTEKGVKARPLPPLSLSSQGRECRTEDKLQELKRLSLFWDC